MKAKNPIWLPSVILNFSNRPRRWFWPSSVRYNIHYESGVSLVSMINEKLAYNFYKIPQKILAPHNMGTNLCWWRKG